MEKYRVLPDALVFAMRYPPVPVARVVRTTTEKVFSIVKEWRLT